MKLLLNYSKKFLQAKKVQEPKLKNKNLLILKPKFQHQLIKPQIILDILLKQNSNLIKFPQLKLEIISLKDIKNRQDETKNLRLSMLSSFFKDKDTESLMIKSIKGNNSYKIDNLEDEKS